MFRRQVSARLPRNLELTMKSSPRENSGQHGKPRSQVRGIEGYLSLALTALLFVIAFLPTPFPSVKEATGLVILILMLVLALRGIRPRPSGNRAAAGRLWWSCLSRCSPLS